MKTPNIFHQFVVAFVGCAICVANAPAQEPVQKLPPVDPQEISPSNVALPGEGDSTTVAALPQAKMPDISGQWFYKSLDVPKGAMNIRPDATFAIHRVQDASADFVFEKVGSQVKFEGWPRLKWSPENQCFEQRMLDDEQSVVTRTTFTLTADGKTLSVRSWVNPDRKKELMKQLNFNDGEIEQFSKQEWTRIEAPNPTVAAAAEAASELPPSTPRASENMRITVFTLANASASEISRIVKDLIVDAKISADMRTNSVIVTTSDEERLRIIEAVVRRLDETSANAQGPKVPESKPMNGISFTQAALKSAGDSDHFEGSTLTEAVAEHEAKARQLAKIIRSQSKELGDQHPRQVEARRQLHETLATALNFKLKLESSQIKSLEKRMTRLKAQIDQRQSLSKQIVERRAAELLEGDALKWNQDNSQTASPTVPSAAAAFQGNVMKPVQPPAGVNPVPPPATGANVPLSEPREDGGAANATRPVETVPPLTDPADDSVANAGSRREGFAIPSYQEFAGRLVTMDQSVTDAESNLKRAKILKEKMAISADELRAAERQVESAIRSRTLIRNENVAVIRDLELQVESARLELEAATINAEQTRQLAANAVVSADSVRVAELRHSQARIALERLNVRYDLYKKAGDGAKTKEPVTPPGSGRHSGKI